ncbi:hypothetical protein M0811_04805 [Anaeramoeba ignava]|uniref:Uncharacterized protein n=1 Tax=Anaeramoeba ignava TaxID=1746090 RepID=A0A9Q0LV70_ANAIG|nr:hypothetical protein M0811_04805 [Anaeramoeba ignava]
MSKNIEIEEKTFLIHYLQKQFSIKLTSSNLPKYESMNKSTLKQEIISLLMQMNRINVDQATRKLDSELFNYFTKRAKDLIEKNQNNIPLVDRILEKQIRSTKGKIQTQNIASLQQIKRILEVKEVKNPRFVIEHLLNFEQYISKSKPKTENEIYKHFISLPKLLLQNEEMQTKLRNLVFPLISEIQFGNENLLFEISAQNSQENKEKNSILQNDLEQNSNENEAFLSYEENEKILREELLRQISRNKKKRKIESNLSN